MVFTEEDRVVIKFLHQNNGHNAKNLVKEFPLKIGKFDLVAVILNTCCDSDVCCLFADSNIKHFMFAGQVMKLMITS